MTVTLIGIQAQFYVSYMHCRLALSQAALGKDKYSEDAGVLISVATTLLYNWSSNQ